MSFYRKPYEIKSVDDLYKCKPFELEQQANILLYGHANILEEACERQVFSRWIYIPRNLTEPLVYKVPKQIRERQACVECGRLRSDSSGKRCSFCYYLSVRLKYFDKRGWVSYWDSKSRGGWENGGQVGIAMPVTEWWDDHDIPAHPKRLAIVDWS